MNKIPKNVKIPTNLKDAVWLSPTGPISPNLVALHTVAITDRACLMRAYRKAVRSKKIIHFLRKMTESDAPIWYLLRSDAAKIREEFWRSCAPNLDAEGSSAPESRRSANEGDELA